MTKIKEKSFEERLVELHPKFLETVKEVYPLAVLSSLCIAITAFTQQTYPQVQVYSITAASLFLIAFIVSFVFKILSVSYFALISYVSTALGVLFLLLVINEFSKTIAVVNKTMSLVSNVVLVITVVSLIFILGRFATKTKSKTVRLCRFISLPLLIPFPTIEVLVSVGSYIGAEIVPFEIRILGYVTASISFIFITIAGVSVYMEGKR
jgi:hypothetical protein